FGCSLIRSLPSPTEFLNRRAFINSRVTRSISFRAMLAHESGRALRFGGCASSSCCRCSQSLCCVRLGPTDVDGPPPLPLPSAFLVPAMGCVKGGDATGALLLLSVIDLMDSGRLLAIARVSDKL